MSHYRKIKAEFKNAESLEKALKDLGYEFQKSADGKTNNVILQNNWGHGSSNVAIAVQQRIRQGFYGGFGFSWNGAGYDLIEDDMDAGRQEGVGRLNQVRQRYSFHEITRQARLNGYMVNEVQTKDKTIRLVLSKL
jgi:hypothetical protein